VSYGIAMGCFSAGTEARGGNLRRTLLLVTCLVSVLSAGAVNAETHKSKSASSRHVDEPLTIQVTDDRLTLSLTDVPQVYLYGVIDVDAPERFSRLLQSGKIPSGSDVYLNASSGDVGAGIALGRLFRRGSMVVHLGKPRRTGESNTATCVGACAYAYFGGLYRWAPGGSDRIGLTSAPAANPDQVLSYLKDMGIQPTLLTTVAGATTNGAVWLTADQMLASGLANNGKLPITAKYQPSAKVPYLVLDQVDRHGEHQLTIECKPGSITLTAIDKVGADHARQIVSRGTRSYFEINWKEVLTQQPGGANVVGESITMTRPFPPARLQYIIYAQSVGAWIGGRNNAFRNGFTFELTPVRTTLKNYYQACWEAAPWPTHQDS